jgi:nucleoside phosphorylase
MAPPRICVQVAFLEELAPIARRLCALPGSGEEGFPCSVARRADAALFVVASGMGWERAAAAARFISRLPVDAVILAGLGAGNREDVAPGSLVLASEVRADEAEMPLVPDARLQTAALEHNGSLTQGTFYTTSRVVRTQHEKTAAQQLAAVILEMETYPAASVYAEASIPWVAVRAVSDPVGDPLPLDFARYLTPSTGQIARLRMFRDLLVRPGIWPAFARLARRSRCAARNLACWVEGYVEALVESSARGSLGP